jgi:hypothetical protein
MSEYAVRPGDTDIAFQSALDALVNDGGGVLYIPPGRYRWTKGVVLDQSRLATFGPTGRVNIIGAGAGCVDIQFSPSSPGQTALSIIGGQWGAGAQGRQRIGGFRLLSDNVADGHLGLYVKRNIFSLFEDVTLHQLHMGMSLDDCVGLEFSSVQTTFCNYGTYGTYAGNPALGSPPNELVFNNCHWLACRQYGALFVQSGNVVFNGGSFEAIGKPGNWQQDANRFGLRIANGGLNAATALAMHGTHFETNAGKCDLWLDNWQWPSSYSIVGCDFMKNGNTDFVQDNVFLENVGDKRATFNILNCGFVSVNGYVPNASRRAVAAGNINAQKTTVNLLNNHYQDEIEQPTLATAVATDAGGRLVLKNLPSAATGLCPGALWRDANNFVKVV